MDLRLACAGAVAVESRAQGSAVEPAHPAGEHRDDVAAGLRRGRVGAALLGVGQRGDRLRAEPDLPAVVHPCSRAGAPAVLEPSTWREARWARRRLHTIGRPDFDGHATYGRFGYRPGALDNLKVLQGGGTGLWVPQTITTAAKSASATGWSGLRWWSARLRRPGAPGVGLVVFRAPTVVPNALADDGAITSVIWVPQVADLDSAAATSPAARRSRYGSRPSPRDHRRSGGVAGQREGTPRLVDLPLTPRTRFGGDHGFRRPPSTTSRPRCCRW